MALQVWLPLNGSIYNQGLSGTAITLQNGTATYDNGGKIGKCFYNCSTGSNLTIPCDFLNNELSIAFWIKPNSPTTWMDLFSIGAYANRMEVNNSTENNMYYLFSDDNGLVSSGTQVFSLPNGKWNHIVYSVDGTNVKIYLNGELKKTFPQLIPLSNVFGNNKVIYMGRRRSSESSYYQGYFNDFRIYDEALSPKQVKLISQGLVCHYPMGNIDGKIGGRNLILNGKGNEKAGFFKNFPIVTDEYGELTLTSKKKYRSLSLWEGFRLGVRDYPVGQKYIWSYDIMYTAWNFPAGSNRNEFWMGQRYTCPPSGQTGTGNWRNVTQHGLPVIGVNGCELNKWYHVKQVITIPEQASSNVGSDAYIQFYNSNADVEASVTMRIKNVKLEVGGQTTPWTPAPEDDPIMYDNVIYDTSGYGNNGSVSDSTCPTWDDNSPRYKGCYKFNGSNQYINCGTSSTIQGQTELTVNIWAYMDDWTKFDSRLFSCTEGGGYNTEFYNNSLYFACNVYTKSDKSAYAYNSQTGGYPRIPLSNMKSGWHMFTCVYNASIGDSIYFDGKLYEQKKYTSYGVHYNNAPLFLGAEAGNNANYPTSPYFNGKLSDFRIYFTALSDADILDLYQTSASVDNNGNLLLAGEVIEE